MVVEVENKEKTSAISRTFRIADEHLAKESNVNRGRKAKCSPSATPPLAASCMASLRHLIGAVGAPHTASFILRSGQLH